ELGPDGHPRRGGFLPPVKLPRRMWAGSFLRFGVPLRVGDAVEQTSVIDRIEEKSGRAGALCFVTVHRTVTCPRGVAVEEEQNLVYREAQRQSFGGPIRPSEPRAAVVHRQCRRGRGRGGSGLEVSALLQVHGLTKRFGGLVANDGVDLHVREREIVGLIGPNGAGKTTFFNCVTGQLRIDAGRVVFAGDDLTNRPPEVVARAGIARTFQIVKVFKEMTVLDNVMVGAFLRELRASAARGRALAALELVGLAAQAGARAGDLPVALQ